MNRRLLLLNLMNEKYIVQSFSNVYNSLITSTRNKGKTKLDTIYGNGIIENQFVNYTSIPSTTKNDVVLTNNNDGSFTLSGTASANTTFTFVSGTWEINHYYLIYGLKNYGVNNSVYWYDSYYSQFNSYQDFIYRPTNSSYTQRRITLFIKSGTQVNFTFTPQVIDLTLMFGTGNEPTLLSDNRVQKILNSGYIDYNTGSYKASKVEKITLKDSNNLQIGNIALPQPIELNGAINSHDTFQVLASEYRFTRNMWKYAYTSGDENTYLTDGTTTWKALATPQVINIPKGHLGCKTITELNVDYNSTDKVFFAKINDMITDVANKVFIAKFLFEFATIMSNMGDLHCHIASGWIYFKDLSCNSISDFNNKYGDCVLFYQTNVYVADFINKATYENGGTITTDSDVLPNLDMKIQI